MLGSRFDMSKLLREINERQPDAIMSGVHSDDPDCLELEREIIAVARTIHSARTRVTFRCPVCDDTMQVGDEQRLSEFGALDVTLHKLECGTCGMLTGRVYHPMVGYDRRMIR